MTNRFNLSAWALRNGVLTGYFLAVICLVGTVCFLLLGRSEDPEFSIKVANVTAVWPGASADEMRERVADEIEAALHALPAFNRVETVVTPGFLAMQLWVHDATPPALVDEAFYQFRKTLNDLEPDFPAGLQGPHVDDEFGDVDSILYAVTTEGGTLADLEAVARSMRRAMLRDPLIRKVRLYGIQQRQVVVEYDDARFARLGLAPEGLLGAIRDGLAVHDAGLFDDGVRRLRVTLPGGARSVEAVADLPISVGDAILRLGDLTRVRLAYDEDPALIVRQDGSPAVMVGLVMARGESLDRLDRAADRAIGTLGIPVGVDVARVADQPVVVRRAMGEFFKVFAEAVGIVLGVCFLVLGWRTGIVVALVVPIVLAMTFVAMTVAGIELHRVSLGALIIALGLLVDDAIIAVESMLTHVEHGANPTEAASAAWRSAAFPMLTGTIVTVLGFMPVGFAPSSTGEYMGSMFWVIAFALLSSWVAAVVFTPWLAVRLLKPATSARELAEGEGALTARARRLVGWAVDHPRTVIAALALSFGLAGLGFVTVQKQFFPISERNELFVQLRLPEGSSISASAAAARDVELFLQDDSDAAAVTSYIGQGPPRFWLGMNPALPNPAYSELVIVAADVEARERLKVRLEAALQGGLAAQARSRVLRFTFGPPVGFPVQFRLSGDDPAEMRRIGEDIRRMMANDPRVVDAHLDWNERAPALALEVDAHRAYLFGLSRDTIATRLSLALDGRVAATLPEGMVDLPVILRGDRAVRTDPGRLEGIVVGNQGGEPISLSQVGRIEVIQEKPIIRQRSRDLTLTIRADVVDGAQAPDVSTAIWRDLSALRARLPDGMRLVHGGAWEESMKANLSIAKVLPLSLLLMVSVIVVQLGSLSRLALVLLSAPLGVIGASLVLNVTGAPFGFVALLGLLALSGMDIRNAIILVEQVDANIETGRPVRQAIVEATISRMRPVALTAAAAVLAMIPLSQSTFWGPMALTIMGGLLLATAMTMVVLPALYAFWFRRRIAREDETARSEDAATGRRGWAVMPAAS